MIIEIKGNLLDTDCQVIAHGVNCQGAMGSGVAKALYTKWPKVKEKYYEFFMENNAGLDGENFLGEIDDIMVDNETGKVVVNCFTQQYFGYNDNLYLDYGALENCMYQLFDTCVFYGVDEVAIPKIGCGLAGGDWTKVKEILDKSFPYNFKVKVYYFGSNDG